MKTADMFPIQPLAGQPDTPQATPTATPPVAAIAPQQSANPYRLGQAGGKRVVYGGVATSTSQPLQPAPPTSLPPSVATTDYTQVSSAHHVTRVVVHEVSSSILQTQVGVTPFPPQQEVGVAPQVGVVQQLRHHWFYLRPNERYWIPFSLVDSAHLEQAWVSAAVNPAVPVSGGCGYV